MTETILPVAVINTLIRVDLLANTRLEVILPAALVRHWRFLAVAFTNVFIGAFSMSQLNGCYKHLIPYSVLEFADVLITVGVSSSA